MLPLDAVRDALLAAFTEALVPLESFARTLSDGQTSTADAPVATYTGIDASLNPGLDPGYSVAEAVEVALGGRPFGSGETLAIAATITSVLKSLPVLTCGYSGLMLPPLEDRTLAARAAQQPPTYNITDLLSYSSVCGVGLDTVPIPGDANADDVSRLLLDTGSLSVKWAKPLSCRLFPVPGKSAGEMTEFHDNPHMINSRVFALR